MGKNLVKKCTHSRMIWKQRTKSKSAKAGCVDDSFIVFSFDGTHLTYPASKCWLLYAGLVSLQHRSRGHQVNVAEETAADCSPVTRPQGEHYNA